MPMDSIKLDQTDIGILNLLQKDGHITYKEIAQKLKRNKSTIGERIQWLKRNGYIRNTVTLVNAAKIMPLFLVFTFVELKDHSKENFSLFRQRIMNLPEVMECYQVTGRYDFKLKIFVRDMSAYNAFLMEHITSLDFVGKLESFTVIDETKMQTGYELSL